jgi:SAM-dependent methyltransferase
MKDQNIKDLEEQYNKYIYPKPCENIEKDWIEKKRFYHGDPNYNWHKFWPEKPYSHKKLCILVAGCGSDQAAILAKCNPNHDFIGVDISENSLAHQKKLIKKHGIKNLKLHCNDFRLLKFKKKFDYIISTGVIHHLDDPGSALNYFNQNLKEDGVIYLMVHGDKKAYAGNQLKKLFRKINLNQNKDSIKVVKNIISKLNKYHPAKNFSKGFDDINYNAGVVDLFLHKKETFFSIKEFTSLLSKNGLIIKNFLDGRIKSFAKYFIDNKSTFNKIKNLPLEEQWELAQILNWNDGKIEVVCCKKENYKTSIAYNPVNLEEIYTCIFHDTFWNVDKQNVSILDKGNNGKFDFQFPPDYKIKWLQILRGQQKVSDILKNLKEPEKTNLRNTITFMIESCLLDISFHPIATYQNYYNKKDV